MRRPKGVSSRNRLPRAAPKDNRNRRSLRNLLVQEVRRRRMRGSAKQGHVSLELLGEIARLAMTPAKEEKDHAPGMNIQQITPQKKDHLV